MLQWKHYFKRISLGGIELNIKEIQDLILTMDKTSIENVDIENSEIKISISKNKKSEVITVSEMVSNSPREIEKTVEAREPSIQNQSPLSTTPEETKAQDVSECKDMFVVKSPIVGTFYDASSPDADAFVKVGDKVKEGQTLCIIEAMKIMNQIENEIDGEIYEILVKNEDVVEYDQPLMIIRR